MSGNVHLFIGGPWDGQWRHCDPALRRIRVPIPRPVALAPPTPAEVFTIATPFFEYIRFEERLNLSGRVVVDLAWYVPLDMPIEVARQECRATVGNLTEVRSPKPTRAPPFKFPRFRRPQQ